jgi:hypothetical protein
MPRRSMTIVPLGRGRFAFITPVAFDDDNLEDDGFKIYSEDELRTVLKQEHALSDDEVDEKMEAAIGPGPLQSGKAFAEGRDARLIGLPITRYPYAAGSAAHFEWISGWRSAGSER